MTGRHYLVGGQRYPSVTTILGILAKDGLVQWRGHVGNLAADRTSREAAAYGTMLHGLVETANRGHRDHLDPSERQLVAPYVAWFDEHVSHVIAAERFVVSRRHKFAGTADVVVVMRGDHDATVVDLKSSKSDLEQREWQLQLAAYALALEEEGIDVRRRIVVRMPRNAPDTLHVLEMPENDLVVDQKCFLSVLRIFRWYAAQGPVVKPLGPRIRFGEVR